MRAGTGNSAAVPLKNYQNGDKGPLIILRDTPLEPSQARARWRISTHILVELWRYKVAVHMWCTV